MHLSSGRVDYCSVRIPQMYDRNGEIGLGVSPRRVKVMHNKKACEYYLHPSAPMQQLVQVVRMETDELYFESLQEDELAVLARKYADLLSRAATERLNSSLLSAGGCAVPKIKCGYEL